MPREVPRPSLRLAKNRLSQENKIAPSEKPIQGQNKKHHQLPIRKLIQTPKEIQAIAIQNYRLRYAPYPSSPIIIKLSKFLLHLSKRYR
jgi:hypothetical protein